MRNLKRVATYRNKINKQTHCASANRADKQRPPTLSPPPFHDFVFFLLSCFLPLSLSLLFQRYNIFRSFEIYVEFQFSRRSIPLLAENFEKLGYSIILLFISKRFWNFFFFSSYKFEFNYLAHLNRNEITIFSFILCDHFANPVNVMIELFVFLFIL